MAEARINHMNMRIVTRAELLQCFAAEIEKMEFIDLVDI